MPQTHKQATDEIERLRDMYRKSDSENDELRIENDRLRKDRDEWKAKFIALGQAAMTMSQ